MRWSRWMRWFRRRRSNDDFAAEVESHIAMEVERLVRGGMSADDAHALARRTFGHATTTREHFHEHRPWSGLESVAQDVRYGLRGMRQRPGFTAITVASLAIGIGANTTMFGAIDALLVRTPAHVRDADRVHRFYVRTPMDDGTESVWPYQGYRTYLALRDGVSSLEGVGAYQAQIVSSGRGAEARPIDAVLATSSVFTMLGVRPALGRFFVADEDLDDGAHVAVIGYDAWRAQYGGNSDVLGRTIDVAGEPYTIVGVAPEGFTGIDVNRVDLWLPIGASNRLRRPGSVGPNAGGSWLEIMAKRRATVSLAQAEREATSVYRNLWRDHRRYETEFGKAHAVLGPIVAARGPAATDDAKVSVWVAAVSLLVLLIACANVANLLLLRGLTRSREIALRLSLGATRGRLTRQALVEGALLAVAGAACALLLARWSATAVQRFLLPRAADAGVLDPRLLAFTAIVALGTGMLASFIPALVTARRDFGPLLGGGRAPGSPQRLAVQRMLIGGQVALATLLLIGAGLFVTSLRNVRGIDLGLDAERLLYVRLDRPTFGGNGSPASASTDATYLAMLERVRRVPGVAHAAVSAGEPVTSGWGISLQLRGAGSPAPGTSVPLGRAVGTDYFETMGTTLRRGRFFNAADHVAGANVAIIDEIAAKRYWPSGDPLDPCVHLNGELTCTQIVGVVATTVQWEIIGNDKSANVYVPLATHADHNISMMEIRTTGDPAKLVPALRQAILTVSPDLPWVDIRPLSERLSPQLRPWKLGASMFTAFGVLALCLAAVGLYGLLSYVVAQRTHEIGVRKALGAPRGQVVRVVLRGALAMTAVGVAIGLAAALAAGRLVASQLYGVSPRDPMVFVGCVGVLVVVAVVACLAPARRATRVDPMVALRTE